MGKFLQLEQMNIFNAPLLWQREAVSAAQA